MKRILLTTLALLMLVLARAQFTVDPGVWKLVTINGRTYKVFVPGDFATGSNYYFHVAFYGDGQTNGSTLDQQEPGNMFTSPRNWNGTVHMNNGTVAKFIVVGIPNYGVLPEMYGDAIDSVFKVVGNKVDTSDHAHFSSSGFSGGPGRMWSWLIGSNSPYKTIFRNTISMSPTWVATPNITTRSAEGNHWVWYSDSDNNSGTPPAAAVALYNQIGSSSKKITNQYQPSKCHCATIWDSCMSIAGVGTPAGGNAQSNRWRWLVDPNDGLSTPPPTGAPFVVGQLRQKTFNGKNFLYYLPDTANRPTLKHYFIFNIVDSAGKDSSYAVQRGLAKKYKDGWNGKLPLCTGDTAVFSMFTQLNDPAGKAVMELGIQLALDSLPRHVFDTTASRRNRNVLTAIGLGANTQLTYLMNKFVGGQGTAFFRDNFGAYISVDQSANGNVSGTGWAAIKTPLKSWWWTSNQSGWPYFASNSRVSKDSADNYNPGALTKITEITASYSPITWDSAYSTAGNSPNNNIFHWIIDTSACTVTPPAQPKSPFVIGQLRQKTYNNKNFLYYIPDTAQRSTLKYYFIFNVIDAANKDSAYAVQRGLALKYFNGWNGKQPLCNGDTAVFSMIMQLQNPAGKADMEAGFQLALDSLPNHVFDTVYSQRMRNVLTGIGLGANTQLTYLMNRFIFGQGTALWRKSFGVYISVDQSDNGSLNTSGWADIERPLKSWWWTSSTSGYPWMPYMARVGKDSADNYNPGALTKLTEIPVSYSPITWDSAYSTAGTTSANNVFIWITDTSDCNGSLRVQSASPETLQAKAEQRIGIHPNPVYQSLNINWSADEQGITVINILGVDGIVLQRRSVSSRKGMNRLEMDIQSLSKGQYIIQIRTGHRSFTRKFLKL
ncbi:MAG: T9SS type A sorting domain-containing protein [Chitinophagaceae bacterium]|nr:T9SS type A sorting domain-containing protein [Chitinophagaceae bacterium]